MPWSYIASFPSLLSLLHLELPRPEKADQAQLLFPCSKLCGPCCPSELLCGLVVARLSAGGAAFTASPTFFSVSLSVDRAFTLNLVAKRIRGASKFQLWIHLKLFRGEVVMHTYDLSVVHAKIFSVKILFMARH